MLNQNPSKIADQCSHDESPTHAAETQKMGHTPSATAISEMTEKSSASDNFITNNLHKQLFTNFGDMIFQLGY
jgi:hypothetical protein